MTNESKSVIEVIALQVTFFAVLAGQIKFVSLACGSTFYAVAASGHLLGLAFLALIVTVMAYHAYNCIYK